MRFKNMLKHSHVSYASFPQTIKFKLGQFIIVPAVIGSDGLESSLILDTGSPCVLDFQTAEKAHLTRKKLTKEDGINIDMGYGSFTLTSIPFNNLPMMFMKTDYFKYYGSNGMIGVNAMHNQIWQFNFDDSTIKISDTITDFRNIDTKYRFKFDPLSPQQSPMVKVVVDDMDTVTAMIDTGSPDFLTLKNNFNFNKYAKSHPGSFVTDLYYAKAKRRKHKPTVYRSDDLRPAHLTIGNFKMDSVVVDRYPVGGQNLVGLKFLQQFIVTIDWRSHQIYLVPRSQKSFKTNLYSFGFSGYFDKDIIFVTHIIKGSDAEKNGITTGDKILRINMSPVRNARFLSNDSMLNQETRFDFVNRSVTLRKTLIFH